MSHTLTPGQSLLAQAAASFKANPASWCPGWGVGPDGKDYGFGEEPPPAVIPMLLPCCIDVRLMQLAPQYAQKKDHGQKALAEARAILYGHLEGAKKRRTIWRWNDTSERTVREVTDMMQAASGVRLVSEQEVRDLLHAFGAKEEPKPASVTASDEAPMKMAA